MRMIVSPYHVTRRDPAAMAALLCARRVVTLLPTPMKAVGGERKSGGGDAGRAAFALASRVPTFRAFVKSWAWTQSLWDAGVLTSAVGEDSPASDLFAIGDRIERDDRLRALRGLIHDQFYEDDRQHLGALAADLLKGGSDPGVSVPVAAAIDRFAVRHGLLSVRAVASSVVERAEVAMAQPECAAVVPILVQASAGRLLHAREVLSDVLEEWWAADKGVESAGVSGKGAGWAAALCAGAGVFAKGFAERREEIFFGAGDDEVRAIEGAATFSWLTLPGDAVLRSSLAALTSLEKKGQAKRPKLIKVGGGETIAPEDLAESAPVAALLVKAMGAGGLLGRR